MAAKEQRAAAARFLRGGDPTPAEEQWIETGIRPIGMPERLDGLADLFAVRESAAAEEMRTLCANECENESFLHEAALNSLESSETADATALACEEYARQCCSDLAKRIREGGKL